MPFHRLLDDCQNLMKSTTMTIDAHEKHRKSAACPNPAFSRVRCFDRLSSRITIINFTVYGFVQILFFITTYHKYEMIQKSLAVDIAAYLDDSANSQSLSGNSREPTEFIEYILRRLNPEQPLLGKRRGGIAGARSAVATFETYKARSCSAGKFIGEKSQ